jgi:hypothetical protein
MQPFFDIDVEWVARLNSELQANAIYEQAGKSEDGGQAEMPDQFLAVVAQVGSRTNRKYQPQRTSADV